MNSELNSNNSFFDSYIRMFILLGIIVWCFLIMFPFAGIILWSLILSIALYPLHKKLAKKIGGKPKLASFLLILTILIVFIVPTGIIVNELIGEVKALKVSYDKGALSIPPPSENVKEWPVIGEQIYDFWNTASYNLDKLFNKYKDELLKFGSDIATGILNAASGVVQIILSLLIAGILLTKEDVGEYVLKFIKKAGGTMGDEIANLINKTVINVVRGVIGEALIIAIMNGILFLLAGVPYAGIWALLVFVLAVLQIPVFLVTVPIMIYFFAVKELMPAILWTISVLLVSFSDNFLTPLMLGKNSAVPMPVIYIGVIGGCVLSGFIGIFTGAIVMSIGYILLIRWINPDITESSDLSK